MEENWSLDTVVCNVQVQTTLVHVKTTLDALDSYSVTSGSFHASHSTHENARVAAENGRNAPACREPWIVDRGLWTVAAETTKLTRYELRLLNRCRCSYWEQV